jgi:transcriptional regulator with XRE-family HTH domain
MRHGLYERTIGSTARHLRTNQGLYQDFFGGIIGGSLWAIPNATHSAYSALVKGKAPNLKETAASLAGAATVYGYDKWLRPVGTGRISEGRFLASQYIKEGMIRSAPVIIPAAIVATAVHNVSAPPPSEFDTPNSPWYFSVAQALTGGFGIGTAGSGIIG